MLITVESEINEFLQFLRNYATGGALGTGVGAKLGYSGSERRAALFMLMPAVLVLSGEFVRVGIVLPLPLHAKHTV